MSPIRRRILVVLSVAAVAGGMAPVVAGMLSAQVRKCFAEVCTTIGGKTICIEQEVPCPGAT